MSAREVGCGCLQSWNNAGGAAGACSCPDLLGNSVVLMLQSWNPKVSQKNHLLQSVWLENVFPPLQRQMVSNFSFLKERLLKVMGIEQEGGGRGGKQEDLTLHLSARWEPYHGCDGYSWLPT